MAKLETVNQGGCQPASKPQGGLGSSVPWSHRAIDGASVGVFLLSLAQLVRDMAVGWTHLPPTALSLALALVGGYLAADFASGFVHFLADNLLSENTPIIGKKVIRPFREHHAVPLAITQHDFLETNGASCLISLLPLAPAVAFLDAHRGGTAAAVAVFCIVLVCMVVLTTQLHKWAHMPRAPRAVRWLQRTGLVLRPEEHAKHHAPPFNRNYCISSGVLNPLLDGSGFFDVLARIIGVEHSHLPNEPHP